MVVVVVDGGGCRGQIEAKDRNAGPAPVPQRHPSTSPSVTWALPAPTGE